MDWRGADAPRRKEGGSSGMTDVEPNRSNVVVVST